MNCPYSKFRRQTISQISKAQLLIINYQLSINLICLWFCLKVHTTDRFFAKSFARMNGTLEIVFSCKKTAAMTGDLMQSLEVIPVFSEIFPSAPGKSE
jgi:hypothetical protein